MASVDIDMVTGHSGEGSSAGASSSAITKRPKRFEIKKWNAVALWAWGMIFLIILIFVFIFKVPSFSKSEDIHQILMEKTLLWIIALSAGITSWISVSNAKQIKRVQQVRNARWPGVFAITPSTFIVSAGG